jgi:hypothetical protein
MNGNFTVKTNVCSFTFQKPKLWSCGGELPSGGEIGQGRKKWKGKKL